MAACPSVSAFGHRRPANGLPQCASDAPQCAIAHDGSLVATSSNAFLASENENECSSATPRSNAAVTSGLHVVSKWTRPSFSGAGCSCWASACGTKELASVNEREKTVTG